MLIYDIQGEKLYGMVGTQALAMHAVSGGGRGSKVKPEGDEKLRSWSYWTKENEKKGIRGGIIPPGFYICRYVANHQTFHECIYLEQTITSLLAADPTAPVGVALHNRGGVQGEGAFYIHSRGPKGSDGCIVVVNDLERKSLNKAIKQHDGTPLRVINPYLPDDIRRPGQDFA